MESVHALVQSLFPTILRSWNLIFCLLLRKGKNQASILPLSEGSIGYTTFPFPKFYYSTFVLARDATNDDNAPLTPRLSN